MAEEVPELQDLWPIDENVEEWEGLTFDDKDGPNGKRVINIELDDMDISGDLPSEIGGFDKLSVLALDGNQIDRRARGDRHAEEPRAALPEQQPPHLGASGDRGVSPTSRRSGSTTTSSRSCRRRSASAARSRRSTSRTTS